MSESNCYFLENGSVMIDCKFRLTSMRSSLEVGVERVRVTAGLGGAPDSLRGTGEGSLRVSIVAEN